MIGINIFITKNLHPPSTAGSVFTLAYALKAYRVATARYASSLIGRKYATYAGINIPTESAAQVILDAQKTRSEAWATRQDAEDAAEYLQAGSLVNGVLATADADIPKWDWRARYRSGKAIKATKKGPKRMQPQNQPLRPDEKWHDEALRYREQYVAVFDRPLVLLTSGQFFGHD